ncbi:MAG: hypothetical protein KGJ02_01135 [Verrucomicrobiota bacterium]|nr:hypothetical protein [Verrucomicrobiota bacterium]
MSTVHPTNSSDPSTALLPAEQRTFTLTDRVEHCAKAAFTTFSPMGYMAGIPGLILAGGLSIGTGDPTWMIPGLKIFLPLTLGSPAAATLTTAGFAAQKACKKGREVAWQYLKASVKKEGMIYMALWPFPYIKRAFNNRVSAEVEEVETEDQETQTDETRLAEKV